MAGLENVVRPVVFPNIRPQPARSLPPADDPEKGFCIIKGNGAKQVDVSYSYSMSMSKSRSVETERCVDEARVYQQEDDGTINRENFVDLDVPYKIKSREGKLPRGDGARSEVDGMSVASQPTAPIRIAFYRRVKGTDNIEILGTNVCSMDEDAQETE